MEAEFFFNSIWPVSSVLIVVPLTQFLKSKIPGDWPVSSQLISILLNTGVIYLAKELSGMDVPFQELWPYISTGSVTSSLVHSMVKTKKKNPLKGGKS